MPRSFADFPTRRGASRAARLAVAAISAAAAAACADAPAEARDRDARRSAPPSSRTTTTRVTPDSALLAAAYARAAELPKLRSLLVDWRGRTVGERYYNGATAAAPANIKSVSKTVIATLVGIAIAEGRIRGVDRTLGELLPTQTRGLDPAKRAITVEDLLTMRAGLQSTSFELYGPFVSSRNWVRYVLARPLVAEPGGPMMYSTGSSHLLSAVLTRATGTSTYRFAARTLARPLGIRARPWTTDPQGIYFGGNEMRMTPREMLAFGRLFVRGGRAPSGVQAVPRAWIDSSWVPRAVSPWSGHAYGYGWWMRDVRGRRVYFAWGYGGQFIYVVPSLELVVVTTSDPNASSRDGAHLDAIHALLDDYLLPAVGG